MSFTGSKFANMASSPLVTALAPPPRLTCDNALDCLHKLYPNLPKFAIRHDLDIMMLASGSYKGSMLLSDIHIWLDELLESSLYGYTGSREERLEASHNCAATMMSLPSANATVKPRASETVYLSSIPNTDYSIRLWPGLPSARDVGMDFVESYSCMPVNSPFKFQLWCVPSEANPSLPILPFRLGSVEQGFGILPKDMRPGEEKFMLLEGQGCLLVRKGERDIRFTVPNMHPAVEVDGLDVDILQFCQGSQPGFQID